MVTPERRRAAVAQLQQRFGVSERRACALLGQHRSTQRHQVRSCDLEAQLRSRIKALAVAHPRYGYRRIHVLLLRDGFNVNRKRVKAIRLELQKKGWRSIGY